MNREIGQIAEYGSEEFENNQSVLTILETKTVKTFPHGIIRTFEFYHRSEGYKMSGSCATWTREVWGWRFFSEGSSFGEFGSDKDKFKSAFDSKGKMTAVMYESITGDKPIQDDLERVNCPNAGEIGHSNCGWCFKCNTPAFSCTCTRRV